MTESAISSAVRPRRGAGMLRLIGIFKLSKGVILIAAAISVFRLIHKDLAEEILKWAPRFHIAPGSRIVQDLLDRVLTVTHKQLFVLGIILLVYSAMFIVEGVGLLLLQHWAEWMTVITTCGLIPFEIYEMYHKPGWAKAAAMAVNIVVAIYLIVRVQREAKELRAQKELTPN